MAAIAFANKFTTGNNNVTAPSVTCVTSGSCKLIVLGLTISGSSAMNPAPTFGSDVMTKIGSTVATTEGNVEMYYLVTNTANRNGTISYSNKGGYYHTCDVSTYNSTANVAFETSGSTFSLSGQTCGLFLNMQSNTGSVCVNQYHSGYSSLTSLANNGTVLYKLDRGVLISGSAYLIDTNATSCNMYWSTPAADDFAMIQAAFISATTPATGDITSWNTVAFASMTSLDSVSLSSLGTINTIDTGN